MPTYKTFNAGDVLPASDLNTYLAKVSVGSKLFFGSSAITTDASGYVTVTHGAGFTPSVVIPIPNATGGIAYSAVYGVDTFTSTTFRLRMAGVTGAVSFTVLFLCLG